MAEEVCWRYPEETHLDKQWIRFEGKKKNETDNFFSNNNNTNTRVRRGFRAEQQIRYTYCKSLRLRIPTNEMRHFLNVTVLIIKSCLSILWMNKAIHITHVLYVKVGTYS